MPVALSGPGVGPPEGVGWDGGRCCRDCVAQPDPAHGTPTPSARGADRWIRLLARRQLAAVILLVPPDQAACQEFVNATPTYDGRREPTTDGSVTRRGRPGLRRCGTLTYQRRRPPTGGVRLITRRSRVQIPPPPPTKVQVRAGARAPALCVPDRLLTFLLTFSNAVRCADPIHDGHRGPRYLPDTSRTRPRYLGDTGPRLWFTLEVHLLVGQAKSTVKAAWKDISLPGPT